MKCQKKVVLTLKGPKTAANPTKVFFYVFLFEALFLIIGLSQHISGPQFEHDSPVQALLSVTSIPHEGSAQT
jgi:hypothetical protein